MNKGWFSAFGCLESAESGNTGHPGFQLEEILLLGPPFLFSLSLCFMSLKVSFPLGLCASGGSVCSVHVLT